MNRQFISPGFDTARPLVLLLTLAKHSDNYFCWFQIAFSSRVWSQQVSFACWACPFRHPKRRRGKDDGFFLHFYPVALWHSLNGPFVLKQGKQGRDSQRRSGLTVMGESRAGDVLMCRILLQKPAFPHTPANSPARVSLCVHNNCIAQRGVRSSYPSTVMRDHPRTQPATSSPSSSSLPVPSGTRCILDHPHPLWIVRGQDDEEDGLLLGKDI